MEAEPRHGTATPLFRFIKSSRTKIGMAMNQQTASLLLSCILHAMLIGISLWIKFGVVPKASEWTELLYFDETVLPREDFRHLPQSVKPVQKSEAAASAVEPPPVESLPTELHDEQQNGFNQVEFFSSSLPHVRLEAEDTLHSPAVLLLKKNEPLLLARPGPHDAVEREIERRNLSSTGRADLPQAVAAAGSLLQPQNETDDKPVRIDFVPSPVELAVLRSVWEKPSADDVEIYVSLDSSIQVTAEDVQAVLEKLTAKRLLRRRMVSPRNELTLPFGATVEMSARNRRNRLYRYEANIDQQEMVRFLNAVLYEMEQSAKGSKGRDLQREIAALKEKLLKASR